MSGRILIIDSIATNRIVIKVKLVAAQYQVETCASCAEAKILMADNPPDLIMINLSDPVEDRHTFCSNLRQHPRSRPLAIVALGIADTARARFAALDAGCDDVMPRPVSDVLMLARVRSLLRRHSVMRNWQSDQGVSRAAGFQEEHAAPLAPAYVAVLAARAESGELMAKTFGAALCQPVSLITPLSALALGTDDKLPDLMIVDGVETGGQEAELYRLIADLSARGAPQAAMQLVVCPAGRPDVAAMLLDLGADDVVCSGIEPEELAIRAMSLLAVKQRRDSLRDKIKDGLQAAVKDPLTGLYNRRYADAQLDQIAGQARDIGQEFALLMIDIDHFKSINDKYGHSAGDLVLKELAERLLANFRSIDMVARVGGEEFIVAMPRTDAEAALLVAERLRRKVADTPFDIGGDRSPIKVTISAGISLAGFDVAKPQSISELYDSADAALYKAKAAGRDMVSVAKSAA